MTEKTIWISEARKVPALRRILLDGEVKPGDDISAAPERVRRDLVDQGHARIEQVSDPPPVEAEPPVEEARRPRARAGRERAPTDL